MESPLITVRELTSNDRDWARAVTASEFGSSQVVSRGSLHDTSRLPGLLAEIGKEIVGLLQYRIHGRECEVVVLVSLRPRIGVGRLLLAEAVKIARSAGCTRLWLITTNDNLEAQEFYRAVGWKQVAVHRGAMDASRRLKPEIPEIGMHGIPIEDEIEFEFPLEDI